MSNGDDESGGDDGWGADGHGGSGAEGSNGKGWGSDGHASHGEEGEDKGTDEWGSDGHFSSAVEYDDNGCYLEAITVEFTCTVDTDGKVDPDSIVVPMENAILDDVAEYIESHEDYGGFIGRIHAALEDVIASKCVQNLTTCC